MMSNNYLHASYGSSCMVARLASIVISWIGKTSKHCISSRELPPFRAADSQDGAGQNDLMDDYRRDVSGHLDAYSRAALVVRLPGDEAEFGRPIGLLESSEYAASHPRAKGINSRPCINGVHAEAHVAQIDAVRYQVMPGHCMATCRPGGSVSQQQH